MKLLVGIITCHSLNYKIDADTRDWWESYRSKDPAARQEAIRKTWLRNLKGIDYRFFFGRGNGFPKSDEVFLNCGDAYKYNSDKVKAVCQWALDHGYDYLLRLDDDSYIYPDRLINQTDWRDYDWSGALCGTFIIGAVTFFSRRAMELIAKAKVTHWADDGWVGTVLRPNKIMPHEIASLHCKVGSEYIVRPENFPVQHSYSAFHSCLPEVMLEFYKREYAGN